MEDDLDRIRNAQNQQELLSSFKDFGRSLVELNDRAGRRQMVSIKFNINCFIHDISGAFGMMTRGSFQRFVLSIM